MRRGQYEYIGMALLVLAILIFAILSRLGSQGSYATQTGIIGGELEESYVNVNIQTVLYSTTDGIPLSEIIGDYICYGDKNPDYGKGQINLETEIRSRLDEYYGKGRWLLYVNSSSTTSYVPEIVIIFDGSGSMKDTPNPELGGMTNLQAVTQAVKKVSPSSPIWFLSSGAFSTSIGGKLPANNCDLSIGQIDPGIQGKVPPGWLVPETGESWANVAGYIAENGPPQNTPPYFSGWPNDIPKIVFVSSDERPCSVGPTTAYVDAAITKAVANDVKYYFITPPKLLAMPNSYYSYYGYPLDPAVNQFLFEEITRFSEETGGKAINITSVNDLAIEIEKATKINKDILREFSIDSTQFTDYFRLPTNAKKVLSYGFPLPTPCTTDIDAKGTLFVTAP
ncbi:MAG TPA: hypothetical protein VJB90_06475 [Candidatus Nanoarchaeia archaeon]|nr:hypothetical protein [Candidatus Nanoarchaeia archaeon]